MCARDEGHERALDFSLHDALPICCKIPAANRLGREGRGAEVFNDSMEWERGCILAGALGRSEEHTSELQSRRDLVCRLLPEKKNRPRAPPTAAMHDPSAPRTARRA